MDTAAANCLHPFLVVSMSQNAKGQDGVDELMLVSGLVGFMGYGDLWGLESTVLIFYKSRAGIYG